MSETWRPIEGWPYEVSDQGRVRRTTVGRGGYPAGYLLRPRITQYGYHDLMLRRGSPSERWRVTIHVLVARAYLGPPPDGHEVNHKNGKKLDNRPCNLEYVTKRENNRHAMRMGLLPTGERNGRSKLTANDVRTIRARFARGGVTKTLLGAEFGVSRPVIADIIARRKWKRVP